MAWLDVGRSACFPSTSKTINGNIFESNSQPPLPLLPTILPLNPQLQESSDDLQVGVWKWRRLRSGMEGRQNPPMLSLA